MEMEPRTDDREGKRRTLSYSQVFDLSHPLTPGKFNHPGTHIEVPNSLLRDGFDLADLPVEKLVSPALLLDMGHPPPGYTITCKQVIAAAKEAGGVQEGDMVFLRTGWDRAYGREEYLKSPGVDVCSIKWLSTQGMSLLGIDSAGVENPSSTEHECHLALFTHGIPLIENLARLDQIGSPRRFTAVVAPIAIHGLEAIPARVLALL